MKGRNENKQDSGLDIMNKSQNSYGDILNGLNVIKRVRNSNPQFCGHLYDCLHVLLENCPCCKVFL